MNIVISDPKSQKAYSKKTEEVLFLGKKVGDEVGLESIGLDGYKGKITGGSDKDGFPMKPTLDGTARKKILLTKGTGFKPTKKGQRKRITVRGNIIDDDIHQINIKVIKTGKESLEKIFKGETSEETKEELSAKEKALKMVEETSGKKATAEAAKEEAGLKKGEKRG